MNIKKLSKGENKAKLDNWKKKEYAINQKYDFELDKVDFPETKITLEDGVKKYFVNDKQVTKEELEDVAGFDAEDHYVEKIKKNPVSAKELKNITPEN